MQEALPYKTWLPIYQETPLNKSSSAIIKQKNFTNNNIESIFCRGAKDDEDLENLVKENAVIVFARRGCCMSHVVKRLLQGQGVNPAVHEVYEQDENDVIYKLEKIMDAGDQKEGRVQFPAVFIGGRLFGGLDRVMATHITGELTPVLKQAGALWL